MAQKRTRELTSTVLLARRSWAPLPAVMALHGDADFLKREVRARFVRELFGDEEPWIRRFPPGEKGSSGPPLAEVLDDLRTPSLFSSHRLVILEAADAFVAQHRDALEPLVAEGFGDGHLILSLDRLDLRTRFGRAVQEKGWAVSCQKPFDRPPPWQPDADPWDSDLCRWVAARAREKKLVLEPELAYALVERVGTELATLDEELEKLRSYLGAEGKRVDLEAVEAVAGELREDTIFDLVDAFLARDRALALRTAQRLLRFGYHPPKGSPILDGGTIASLFTGALLSRLRALRSAHALAEAGGGPDVWVARRLTPRPFLSRFQRDLHSTPRERIDRALAGLRELDRSVKTGGGASAAAGLEAFLLRH